MRYEHENNEDKNIKKDKYNKKIHKRLTKIERTLKNYENVPKESRPIEHPKLDQDNHLDNQYYENKKRYLRKREKEIRLLNYKRKKIEEIYAKFVIFTVISLFIFGICYLYVLSK